MGRHDRRAHVELDRRVGKQRDRGRVLRPRLAVEERGDLALLASHRRPAQRLIPLVEEVAERVDPHARGLDMDHAVGRVGVEPVIALLRAPERAVRRLLGHRPHHPDRGRERARIAVDVHLEVRVDVVDELLDRRALDPVDGGALGGGPGRREVGARLERDPLGAVRRLGGRGGGRGSRGRRGRGARRRRGGCGCRRRRRLRARRAAAAARGQERCCSQRHHEQGTATGHGNGER